MAKIDVIDELLTAQEVADIVRVHICTFDRWCRNGEGPPEMRFVQYGARRYREHDVAAWLEQRRSGALG